MNKHTPGPWVAPDPRSDYEGRVFDRSIMAAVSNGNPIPIARAYNNIGTNCEANARLIAAAPDLLAALEALVSMVDNHRKSFEADGAPLGTKEHGLAVCLNNRAGDMITAAIAKARGE